MTFASRYSLLALLAAGAAVPAEAVTIVGYDISQAAVSGVGGWTNTYNGTKTVIGENFANYTGGTSGSLNDGIIPTNASNNQLLCVGSGASCGSGQGDPAQLAPVVTLYLDALSTIASFDFLSAYAFSNIAPGALGSVKVTIGGQSEIVTLSNYGLPNANGDGINQGGTLSTLAALATTQIVLSDWALKNGVGNFSLGEITITGDAAVAAVPEPATWAMMILGFGIIGGALRRKTVRPILAAR